ncbi:tRNA 2'-phosphotransferase [Neophaeococcomyces mojaviensis]|uniref:tRNA 2'-phosphotransferase n=1 Tax=Neophaeococcomyces mojaviensis TaxID=3383035 RepID=A0ACC3ABV7_9EURO|nr:tRNA 2'-phosphotransferase [Knufia sp. JES_112]
MGRTEGLDTASFRSNRDRRGPRSSQPRSVLISKALSRLLRHQAQNEGVPITNDGWVRIDHLLAWRGLSVRNGVAPPPSVEEIWEVVEENEKKRFAVRWSKDPKLVKVGGDTTAADTNRPKGLSNTVMQSAETSDAVFDRVRELGLNQEVTTGPAPEHSTGDVDMQAPSPPTSDATDSETVRAIQTWRSGTDTTESHFLIRATQGHSIRTVASNAELMTPITLENPSSIPSTCVHGTFYGSWPLILKSGGLKPMGRNHVHFAMGPTLSEVLPQGKQSDTVAGEPAKVISGMRHDAQILIYVDLKRCLEDVKEKGVEMEWWRSENNVILTAGVDPTTVQDATTEDLANSAVEAGGITKSSQPSSILVAAQQAADFRAHSNWKQSKHGKQQEQLAAKLVPIKYWTHAVEVKRGLGLIWKQGEGVVKELPPDLLARGTPKGPRGGGRGGRGRGQ